MEDSQGIGQIQMFLKHWRTPGHASDLTKIAIAWWQFVSGTSRPIMEDMSKLAIDDGKSESKLIRSLRGYLRAIGATIEVDRNILPPLQRENDAYLMDLVNASNMRPSRKYYANLVRMSLQVSLVSDLCQADGINTDRTMWLLLIHI